MSSPTDGPPGRARPYRARLGHALHPHRTVRSDHTVPLDVLVLGAELRQALVAVRSLGRAGRRVGAADCGVATHLPTYGSRWCCLAAELPDVAHDPEAFRAGLVALLEECPAAVVLPVHDGMVHALIGHRDVVEQRSALALPPEPALRLLSDKSRTLELASSLGVPVPEGVVVTDPARLEEIGRKVGFPAVVKPAESWVVGDAGATRLFCHDARDPTELRTVVTGMLAAGGRPIVQPWLPGARESVSLFVADGRVRARFAQVAHRMHPPLGGSSIYRESIPLPPDATLASEGLLLAAGLDGYAEVEFRRDDAGRAVLMEVNPRLSASVELAVRSGIDFPALVVARALGRPVPVVVAHRVGVRMRWLGGDLRWLARAVTTRGRVDVPPLHRAVRDVLTATVRPSGYDYLDPADLRPAVWATAETGRQALRRWRQALHRAGRTPDCRQRKA